MEATYLLNQSYFMRSLIVFPLAACVSIGVFVTLAYLTSPGQAMLEERLNDPDLQFLLVRKDSDLELLNRKRLEMPKEVTEVQDFTRQKMSAPETLSVDINSVDIEMPSLDIEIKMDMKPALANLGSGVSASQDFSVDIPFQQNPRAIKNSQPRYPSRALRKKIEGTLVAEFVIDSEGFVKEDSIVFIEANPEGVFEQSVRRSLKRSRFETVIVSGVGVEYRARKAYHYEIPK